MFVHGLSKASRPSFSEKNAKDVTDLLYINYASLKTHHSGKGKKKNKKYLDSVCNLNVTCKEIKCLL